MGSKMSHDKRCSKPQVELFFRLFEAHHGGHLFVATKKWDERCAYALMQGWGIATRPGAHCAPLMHRALGTERQGVVRFSFGYFNTTEEVDTAIDALCDLAC